MIAKTAVLVSDYAAVYCAFASKAGLAHVALNLSAGERVKRIYHIQNVNNYDSRLKGWLRRFNGVATNTSSATSAGIALAIVTAARYPQAVRSQPLGVSDNMNPE